jgi:hypothetical protein
MARKMNTVPETPALDDDFDPIDTAGLDGAGSPRDTQPPPVETAPAVTPDPVVQAVPAGAPSPKRVRLLALCRMSWHGQMVRFKLGQVLSEESHPGIVEMLTRAKVPFELVA